MDFEFVDAIQQGQASTLDQLSLTFSQMQAPIAVRSSGIGEDSGSASFAGQHATVLNVMDFDQLRDAISEVVASASTGSAIDYREKLGMEGSPRMAIVLQEMLACEAAGVLFTRNPLNGNDERVIEAAWGLGEVVVAGLVIPDYHRVSPTGDVIETRIGEKDIELRPLPEGGTEEIELPVEKAEQRILSDSELLKLNDLASRCESVYGSNLDIEWGRTEEQFWLLQCRAITTAIDN